MSKPKDSLKGKETPEPVSIEEEYVPDAEVVYYHGDCMDLLPEIPDETVQLVVTSPPYNIGKEYESKKPLDKYKKHQKKVIKECLRVLKPEGSICWEVGNYVESSEILPLDILIYNIFSEIKEETEYSPRLRNRIVWHFGHGLHCKKRFSGRHETILWFTKTDDYVFNLDPIRIPQKYPNKKAYKGPKKGELSGHPKGKNPSDVWEIPNVKANHPEKTIHPCQFPVALIERLVLALTNEGDIVLDPFAGVGSANVAAIKRNRRTIGAEKEKKYVEIARERIKKASIGKLEIRPLNKPIYKPDVDPATVEEFIGGIED